MVGFALAPDFRRRTFTEIAAFESPEAMRAFGSTPEHAAAIRAMVPHMAPGSKMVSIELYGRDLPPRPEVAKAALEATPGIEELGRQPGQALDDARPDRDGIEVVRVGIVELPPGDAPHDCP